MTMVDEEALREALQAAADSLALSFGLIDFNTIAEAVVNVTT